MPPPTGASPSRGTDDTAQPSAAVGDVLSDSLDHRSSFKRSNSDTIGTSPACNVGKVITDLLLERLNKEAVTEGEVWTKLSSDMCTNYAEKVNTFLDFAWEYTARNNWEAAQASIRAAGDADTILDQGPFLDEAVCTNPEALIEACLANFSDHRERQKELSVVLGLIYPRLVELGLTTLKLDRYLFFTPPEKSPPTRMVHEVWGHFYDRSHNEAGESRKPGDARRLSIPVARDYGVVWNKFQDFLWQEFGATELAKQELTLETAAGRERAQKILSDLIFDRPDLKIEMYLELLPNERARQAAKATIVTNIYAWISATYDSSKFDVEAFDFRPRRSGVLASPVVIDFFDYLYRRSLPLKEGEIPQEKHYTPLSSRNYALEVASFFRKLNEQKVEPALASLDLSPRARFEQRAKLLDQAIKGMTRDDIVQHIATIPELKRPGAATALFSILVPWLKTHQHLTSTIERYVGEGGVVLNARAERHRQARRSPTNTSDEQRRSAGTRPPSAPIPLAPAPPPPAWKFYETPLLSILRARANTLPPDTTFGAGSSQILIAEAQEWCDRYFHFLSQNSSGTTLSPAEVDVIATKNPEPNIRSFLKSLDGAETNKARASLLEYLYPELVAAHSSNYEPRLLDSFHPPASAPVLPEFRKFWLNLKDDSGKHGNPEAYLNYRGWLANEFFSDAWKEVLVTTPRNPTDSDATYNATLLARFKQATIENPAPVLELTLARSDARDRPVLSASLKDYLFEPLRREGLTNFAANLHAYHPLPTTAPRVAEVRDYYDILAKRLKEARVAGDTEIAKSIEREIALVHDLENKVWELEGSKGSSDNTPRRRMREALFARTDVALRRFLHTLQDPKKAPTRDALLCGFLNYAHSCGATTFNALQNLFLGEEFKPAPRIVQEYARKCYTGWRDTAGSTVRDSNWETQLNNARIFHAYTTWLVANETGVVTAGGTGNGNSDPLLLAMTQNGEACLNRYLQTLIKRQRGIITPILVDAHLWLAAREEHSFDPQLIVMGSAR